MVYCLRLSSSLMGSDSKCSWCTQHAICEVVKLGEVASGLCPSPFS